MKETRCIICGEKKEGLEVNEDGFVSTVRWFKRHVTKNEKGYRLVVCKTCYPKYHKELAAFQRRRLTYVAIGVVFAILLAVGGQDKLLAIVYGLIIIAFTYVLSLMNYVPALSAEMQRQKK